jgi:outer membrane scaffolding protein for murein synthesis (MipA/OmpV family)
MMRYILLFLALVPVIGFCQETNLIGASVRTRPKFDGSSERTVDLIPNLRYYGGPWFARTTQGALEAGARTALGSAFHLGAQLGYEQGPQDRDPGASAGAHLEWDGMLGPAPVDALLRVRQHLDTDRGAQMDLRSNLGVYKGHGFIAGLFAQATWGNEKYFESYYGVRESGLVFASLGAWGGYDLTQRWLLVANVEGRRLSDEAMRGPLSTHRTGTSAYAGVAYRF